MFTYECSLLYLWTSSCFDLYSLENPPLYGWNTANMMKNMKNRSMIYLHKNHSFLDDGYIAIILCCSFFWPGKKPSYLKIQRPLNYANCRNTGTLDGDFAGTNFVLFLTKIESYIVWQEFSNCSNDKYLIEIQIYVNNWQ